MKTKKIVFVVLLIAYIVLCSFLNSTRGGYPYRYTLKGMKNYSKVNNYNFTTGFNTNVLKRILAYKYKNPYNRDTSGYIDLFNSFNIYNESIVYYITNVYDVKKLMEENDITNPNNINIGSVEFKLPIEDESYKNVFRDLFTAKKQEAKVIGKTEDGYSKFDISPDALVIATMDKEIIAYGYIDNRLADMRDIMNKQYYSNRYTIKGEKIMEMYVKETNPNSYNKFVIVEKKIDTGKEVDDDMIYKD